MKMNDIHDALIVKRSLEGLLYGHVSKRDLRWDLCAIIDDLDKTIDRLESEMISEDLPNV